MLDAFQNKSLLQNGICSGWQKAGKFGLSQSWSEYHHLLHFLCFRIGAKNKMLSKWATTHNGLSVEPQLFKVTLIKKFVCHTFGQKVLLLPGFSNSAYITGGHQHATQHCKEKPKNSFPTLNNSLVYSFSLYFELQERVVNVKNQGCTMGKNDPN